MKKQTPKPELKKLAAEFRDMRESLGLTQEYTARLLQLDSVMTPSRWERALYAIPPRMFVMLPALATGKRPQPCSEGRKIGFDPDKLAGHLPKCERCQDAVTYLHWADRAGGS